MPEADIATVRSGDRHRHTRQPGPRRVTAGKCGGRDEPSRRVRFCRGLVFPRDYGPTAIAAAADVRIGVGRGSVWMFAAWGEANVRIASGAGPIRTLACLSASGTFAVLPAGRRPLYCLSVGALSSETGRAFPAGFDDCASGPVGTASRSSHDSGQGAHLPIRSGKITLLSILTPVYRYGVLPATVAGRHRAFLGWVGMSVLPQIVLARVLQRHPDTAVSFRYHSGPWNAMVRTGNAPSGAQTNTIALRNGWPVETFGAVAGAGVFDNWNALAL